MNNFQDVYDRLSSANDKNINEEFALIRKEHKLNNNAYARMYKAYKMFPILTVGNFKKNIDFLNNTLIKLGYNEEEVDCFLNRNTELIITDFENLRFRLSLFNELGIFEDVLLKYNSILTLTAIKNISSKELYAVIMSGRYNINLNDFSNLYNIPDIELKRLVKAYPLTGEERTRLYLNMRNSLKNKILKKSEF